ncbi:hypothetical protein Ciccas_004559 [Cichlidogyrus casuarinus]|uniref:Uncharacterized protein n=1 Tax=Cichlidogyrus casuarinus TaxID=1844966 RepID=A0ABD2QB98_9PLAT
MVTTCVDNNLLLVDLQEKYFGLLLLVWLRKAFNVFAEPEMTQQIFLLLAKGNVSIDLRKIIIDLLISCWIPSVPQEGGEAKLLLLAECVKKVVLEDASNQTCLQMLSFMLRHEQICFSVRNELMPVLHNMLTKLSSPSQQPLTIDHKRLLIDVIEMAVKWNERSRRHETLDAVSYPWFSAYIIRHLIRESKNKSSLTKMKEISTKCRENP